MIQSIMIYTMTFELEYFVNILQAQAGNIKLDIDLSYTIHEASFTTFLWYSSIAKLLLKMLTPKLLEAEEQMQNGPMTLRSSIWMAHS